MLATTEVQAREELERLEQALVECAHDIALFLVYDRPERSGERPGLARTFFAQRCVADEQLDQTLDAFRSVGAYVELFEGERPLFEALAARRLQEIPRRLKVVYNGIEGGITADGFAPGRKALIPAVADSYGLICANSNACACALGRHKFHYFTVLHALGVRTPTAWHYRPSSGWVADLQPPRDTKVIVKSTYESWSVGVTDESIFVVDGSCEARVASIAGQIGQPVTVQRFVPGAEVCVTVLATPDRVVPPPVEAILAKAPRDANAVMTIDDNLRHLGVTYERFVSSQGLVGVLAREALASFDALELEAFGRIDFRVDSDGEPWVIDVGVSPGLSTGSSAFHSVAELGFDHASFLRIVIAATLGSRGLLT